MAVMITDGIGRPLYGLDGGDGYTKRRHPYTHEVVADDYEYPHPGGDLSGGYVFLALAFVLLMVVVGACCWELPCSLFNN